jgi:hypothetical protein
VTDNSNGSVRLLKVGGEKPSKLQNLLALHVRPMPSQTWRPLVFTRVQSIDRWDSVVTWHERLIRASSCGGIAERQLLHRYW